MRSRPALLSRSAVLVALSILMLGRAAREFLESQYSLKVATDRLEESYRELVHA